MFYGWVEEFKQKDAFSEPCEDRNGFNHSNLDGIIFEFFFWEDIFADVDDIRGEDFFSGMCEETFEGQDVAMDHIEISVLQRTFYFVVDFLQPFLLQKHLTFSLADLFDAFIQEI